MKKALLLLFLFVLTASSINDARKANEAYQRGDYELAAQLYHQAIEQNPEDARLYFNLGNSLSELGRTEEAIEAFNQFKNLTESEQEQALADYNKGRALTNEAQYEEALEHFREALKKNPNDSDARHNYELAVRRQQEQEQEQEQQQPEQDSDGQDDQDQQQDQQNQDDQQQDQEQEQQQDSGQPDPQDQDGEQEQQPLPQDMSREEAENILDALEQLERELLENQKKEPTKPQSSNDKDW